MSTSHSPRRDFAWAIALRGLLIFVTGLIALLFPDTALTVLVGVGGTLLLVDGVLGLWARVSGGIATGNVWYDYIRNILAIVSGALIIISPSMATTLTVTVLVYLVAIQAIVVGVMEVLATVRDWKRIPNAGLLFVISLVYVVFGVVLIASPMLAANLAVATGGFLGLVFSFALFASAWRVYRLPDPVAA